MLLGRQGKTIGRWFLMAVIVGSLLLLAIGAIAKPGDKPPKDKPDSKTFVIEGSADGFLYPGVAEALPVVFVNPINTAISIDQVTITVGDASMVCAAESVTVGVVPVPVLVDKRGDTTVEVPIVLSVDAADACQGTVFPIVYEGVATKR